MGCRVSSPSRSAQMGRRTMWQHPCFREGKLRHGAAWNSPSLDVRLGHCVGHLAVTAPSGETHSMSLSIHLPTEGCPS